MKRNPAITRTRRVVLTTILAGLPAILPAQSGGDLRLRVSDDSPRMGRELTLSARTPVIDGRRRFTFLFRFDDENRWTTILHRTEATDIRWTPRRSGSVELRVDAVTPGEGEMRHTVRTYVLSGQEGVRQSGRSSAGLGSFPDYPEKVGLHVDRPSGLPGEARQVYVRLGEARNGRRVTFMVRHESDAEWRILRQNSDTLSFRWTPDRAGRFQLRVDTGEGNGDDRAQIAFTCLDPDAPARARQRGS